MQKCAMVLAMVARGESKLLVGNFFSEGEGEALKKQKKHFFDINLENYFLTCWDLILFGCF